MCMKRQKMGAYILRVISAIYFIYGGYQNLAKNIRNYSIVLRIVLKTKLNL